MISDSRGQPEADGPELETARRSFRNWLASAPAALLLLSISWRSLRSKLTDLKSPEGVPWGNVTAFARRARHPYVPGDDPEPLYHALNVRLTSAHLRYVGHGAHSLLVVTDCANLIAGLRVEGGLL